MRLREAFDRIERSSIPEVLPRVAAALATLAPDGARAGTPLVIELPVRSSEFAAIGVAPESLSRAITKLFIATRSACGHRRAGPRNEAAQVTSA